MYTWAKCKVTNAVNVKIHPFNRDISTKSNKENTNNITLEINFNFSVSQRQKLHWKVVQEKSGAFGRYLIDSYFQFDLWFHAVCNGICQIFTTTHANHFVCNQFQTINNDKWIPVKFNKKRKNSNKTLKWTHSIEIQDNHKISSPAKLKNEHKLNC